jgi:hypothetical protein
VYEHVGEEDLQQGMQGIGIQGKGMSEVRVLACATGQMAGLVNQSLCLDVCVCVCVCACVKGHQESNLKPRSKDRSFANAPARTSLLYWFRLHCCLVRSDHSLSNN